MSRVRIGHNSERGYVEDESLSLSERGYEFQFRLVEQLLRRLRGFATVTLRDMNGNAVTLDNHRKRGRDGGLDIIVDVDAKTEGARKTVHAKVLAIMLDIE